jgi:ATP-dependent Clp protease ATP-binding subunit ClpC
MLRRIVDRFAKPRRMKFDKFTENAIRALYLANDEALRLRHDYVGTEHLLLGVLRLEESTAVRVLVGLHIRVADLRQALEKRLIPGATRVVAEQALNTGARKAIESAVDEARRVGLNYIGTEHLLLGVIRDEEGPAAPVLREFGVRLDWVRAEVSRVKPVQ